MQRKSLTFILIASILITVPMSVDAHVSIPTVPSTSCGSLDSLDLTTHISNQIDSRLVGRTTSTDWKLFNTSGTIAGTTYVRNTNIWTNGGSSSIDWTGISPYNTSGGYHTPGTLISPRHVVMANHYMASVGAKMIFVDNTNTVFERTITGSQNIAGTDIQIGVLDSDVPDSVTYYSVIASSTLVSVLQKYTSGSLDIPIVSFDQEKKAIVRSMTSNIGIYPAHNTYLTGSRSVFSENVISGDSGNSNFILIDNQAVLLGSHYGANGFPNLGAYMSQINSAMTSLGGGYQLTEYTPETCFNNYAPLNNIPNFTGVSYSSLAINQFNLSTTTVVKTYTASDTDVGQTLTFSLVGLTSNSTSTSLTASDYFSLNASTGELRQIQSVNTNVLGSSFNLSVNVSDNATHVGSTTMTTLLGMYHIDGAITIDLDENFVSTSTNQSGIRGIIPAPDGSLYLAHNWTEYRNYFGLNQGNILKFNPDGSMDSTYVNNQGIGATSTTPSGAIIQDLFLDDNSRIVIVGSFQTFGTATSSGIARLNADGTLDTAFSLNTGSGLPAGQIVRAVPVGGKIMAITTSGSTTFDGVTIRRLFMLNGDGTIDSNFSATASSSLSGFTSTFQDFITYSDTQVLVGSNFASYNGTPVGRIARINIDGTLDTTFSASLGTGFNSNVTALGKLSDGRIVVGGIFTTLNGNAVPFIVGLNADGSLNSTFMTNIGTGPNISNNLEISVQSDDKIVIGGQFASFNGVSTPSPLIRLNSDGTIDPTFTEGLGLGYTGSSVSVQSLKRFPDDRLAVYGNYNYYNNVLLYGPHILETSTPPIVTNFNLATSTDSGQYIQDNITNSSTLTFNGSGTPSAILYVKEGSTVLGTTTVNASSSWSLDLNLPEGSKSLKVAQTLDVLNTATSSDSLEMLVIVDRTAPTLNGTSLAVANNMLLHFTEDFATTSSSNISDWSITQNGTTVGISNVEIVGSNVYLGLSESLRPGTTIVASFTGSGLSDVAGNQMQAFAGQIVGNITPVAISVQTTVPSSSPASTGGGSTGGGGGYTPFNAQNTKISVNNATSAKATTTPSTNTFLPAVKNEALTDLTFIYKPNRDVIALKFRSISVGAVGVDVLELQRFLNNNNFLVSKAGAGSKGKETRFFGPATRNALIRFQKAAGITPAVGFFGPVTKRYILSK